MAEAANEEGAMTLEEAQAKVSMAERNVPPFDLAAETPEEAYPLDRIISQVEWEGLSVEVLERAAKSVHAAKAIRQKYSKHVMNRLRLLIVSVSSPPEFFGGWGFEGGSRVLSLFSDQKKKSVHPCVYECSGLLCVKDCKIT